MAIDSLRNRAVSVTSRAWDRFQCGEPGPPGLWQAEQWSSRIGATSVAKPVGVAVGVSGSWDGIRTRGPGSFAETSTVTSSVVAGITSVVTGAAASVVVGAGSSDTSTTVVVVLTTVADDSAVVVTDEDSSAPPHAAAAMTAAVTTTVERRPATIRDAR